MDNSTERFRLRLIADQMDKRREARNKQDTLEALTFLVGMVLLCILFCVFAYAFCHT